MLLANYSALLAAGVLQILLSCIERDCDEFFQD